MVSNHFIDKIKDFIEELKKTNDNLFKEKLIN